MRKGLLTLLLSLLAILTVSAEPADVRKEATNEPDHIQWSLVDPTIDYVYWNSIGPGTSAQISGAYHVDGKGLLKGTKIVGVDVPAADYMSDVSVWVRSSLSGDNIAGKSVSEINSGEYYFVKFKEPVVIPEEGLYVGYTCTTTRIAAAGTEKIPGSLYYQVDGSEWADYSTTKDWGSLLLPLEVSGLKLKDNAASFSSFATQPITVAGKDTTLILNLKNDGTAPVASVDYTVSVDGVKTQHHANLTQALKSGFYHRDTLSVGITAPAEAKHYTVSVNVDKVNDHEVSGETTETTLTNVLRKAARRTVVEDYAGLDCDYDPEGWAGMKLLADSFPDKAIEICIHQYNNSDPMFTDRNYPVTPSYTNNPPLCVIDRGDDLNPWFGSKKYKTIVGDVAEANKVLPTADVTVSGTFSDYNTVNAQATVEYLTDKNDYSLAFVLTADGLTGTGDKWSQANHLYMFQADPEHGYDVEGTLLADFCAGGKYGTDRVAGLVFDNVKIACSYKYQGKQNLAPALNGGKAGDTETVTYQLKLPTNKKDLMAAIHHDSINVVALLVDNATGRIVNGAKVRVEDPTGVKDFNSVNEAAEVARYTLDGRRIYTPVKGLNIVIYANGKVRKEIVK